MRDTTPKRLQPPVELGLSAAPEYTGGFLVVDNFKRN